MLTSLLIKALRPVLVPLFLEALEQHARAHPPWPVSYYANGSSFVGTIRQSPMQGETDR